MNRIVVTAGIVMLLLPGFVIANEGDDWLAWRGPLGSGITENQTPPTSWSDSENVLWKTAVPGRGHASPTVVGNQIVLATSDKASETQSVISFDFETGNQLWQTTVNEGNFNPRIYPTNTHASSTVVSDGERLFALFNNNESAQIAALDLEGNLLWSKKAADFIPKRYQFGFGSSPVIYKDTVIVTSECERDGSMVALNVKDGSEVWRVERTAATSYSTPSIATVAGREQLFLSGGQKVDSYDPSDGSLIWSVDGPWQVTCGTPVWNNDTVFVSGGYPAARTMAVRADGSGEVVWENRVKFYEQSMLFHDGYIYGLADNGAAYCFRASDGEEMWRQRLEDKISASPVLAGGNIYISVEKGRTYVFPASPDGYQEVAVNQLGNTAYATPTFVRNKVIARVATGEGKEKQEFLYCIGN